MEEGTMPGKKCKITVIRKDFHEDLYRQCPAGPPGPCGLLEVGRVFVTDSEWSPPEGLCPWAWADMRSIIQGKHAGDPQVKIVSCTDGLRPVLFKLECIEG
ncbi:MAG: TIGR04076 family protein [Anaerolineales bacterium]|nr:TIGR04076 family protein [Anaerolineales bacterium]